MEWSSAVIADLCAAKARGESFDAAWTAAVRRHRSSGRDMGEPEATLFDAARRAGEESLPAFLRRVAGDAWHGRNPGVRRLAVLLEADVFPVAERFPVERPGQNRKTAA